MVLVITSQINSLLQVYNQAELIFLPKINNWSFQAFNKLELSYTCMDTGAWSVFSLVLLPMAPLIISMHESPKSYLYRRMSKVGTCCNPLKYRLCMTCNDCYIYLQGEGADTFRVGMCINYYCPNCPIRGQDA